MDVFVGWLVLFLGDLVKATPAEIANIAGRITETLVIQAAAIWWGVERLKGTLSHWWTPLPPEVPKALAVVVALGMNYGLFQQHGAAVVLAGTLVAALCSMYGNDALKSMKARREAEKSDAKQRANDVW